MRLSLAALFVTSLVIPSLAATADDPAQLKLLKTFREEFVRLTPGEGKFPGKYTRGDLGGMADNSQGITLKQPFSIAKYEVPQDLWEAVMGENPSRWKGARNSVEMMTFDDSVRFCQKATALMREAKLIGPKEVIRIPSEAEWEYATRAGTATPYSFGDDAEKLGEFGWFHGNAAGNDPPVGAKKPNPWGLYDTHGYLWEFCSDAWSPNFEGSPTDGAPRPTKDDKAKRVIRGGSWKDEAPACRSGSRRAIEANGKDDAVGLRCVLAEE